MEVKDFKSKSLSMDDFKALPKEGAWLGSRTASQNAAVKTLLTEQSLEEYHRNRDNLINPASREQFLMENQAIRDQIWENSKSTIGSILADPSYTDDQKMNFISIVQNPLPEEVRSSVTSTLDLLAEKSALSEPLTDETDAEVESRFNSVDSIKRVNEYKRNMQALINGVRADLSPTIGGTVKDVVELMVPFAEWIHYDRLQKDIMGDDHQVSLLGQQKQRLFDHIQGMSLEERERMAQTLIDVIQNNDTVVLPDGNDLVTLDALEQMLGESDYSNFNRWFDNVISVLDIVGVGGIIGAGRKALKAGRVVEMEKAAEELETGLTVRGGIDGEIVEPGTSVAIREESEMLEAPYIDGTYEDVTDRLVEASQEATRTDVSPTSPSQIAKDHNPEQAKEMKKLVDENGEEAAEALYGSNVVEAEAKTTLPEPAKPVEEGAREVPNKTEMNGPLFEEPENIRTRRQENGNLVLTDEEVDALKSRLISGFEEIGGMVLHKASLAVRSAVDGSFSVMARYSPVNRGVSTAQQALDNAAFAFRNYGLDESDFVLLRRDGSKWVETTKADAQARETLKANGADLPAEEYAIGIDYNYRFKPEDLTDAELLTTGGGFISNMVASADRMGGQFLAKWKQGSLVQNLMDPSSIIHPRIVGAASVAVDKAFSLRKMYVDLFEDFTKTYKKSNKPRRTAMSDYIHEANLKGIPFDKADLAARGFSRKEIKALEMWRRANDAMWYAANADMVKTLRGKGAKVFVHKDSDTLLVGVPRARGAAKGGYTFDPKNNINIRPTSKQLDELYEKGGEIIELMEPMTINGKDIKQVWVRNTPDGGYIRSLKNEEKVLSYREGYYPVMYDANHFIEKLTLRDGSEVNRRVVASARNQNEVKAFRDQVMESERITEEEFNRRYRVRKDRRLTQDRGKLFDEGSWSLATNSGMTMQRVRGKRLEEAGVDLHKRGYAHLEDPLRAVAAQIQSLSQRASMRTYLDTVKTRWIQGYSKYLDLPINPNTGKPMMPRSIDGVKAATGAPPKMVASARTMYNYIYSLENGYINGLDNMYKSVLHWAADYAGELGLGKVEEKMFAASRYSPTQKAKGTVFKMFIASNPARQALIQRGQLALLPIANPKYATTQLGRDMIMINRARAGIKVDKKYQDLWDEVKTSGIIEAVDAHTLIRDDLLRLADISFGEKLGGWAMAPLDLAQKVGFDWAEQDVLLSAWLTFRDKALRAGKDIKNQRVRDEIHAEARAFTLNMNRSGEMAYSHNTLAVATQFFSFQHKAFLQGLTNRSLSKRQRAALLAYSAALFGVEATLPTALIANWFKDQEPSVLRDKLEDGLIDITLNGALTLASGEDQAIDWGDFAPVEAYGVGNMFVGVLEGGFVEMIQQAPAGSLLFGTNPRLLDMMKTATRAFVPLLDYQAPELDTKASDVVQSALQLFSGYSSAFKARYAWETGKKLSGTGSISDEDVTKIEAAMQTLGFRTKDEEGFRKVYEIMYGNSSFTDDDVKLWFSELKRQLARRGDKPSEMEYMDAVIGEAWRVFGDEQERAMGIIMDELQRDANNRDMVMLQGLIYRMGANTNSEVWEMINQLPDGYVRDQATETMKAREELLNDSIRD